MRAQKQCTRLLYDTKISSARSYKREREREREWESDRLGVSQKQP